MSGWGGRNGLQRHFSPAVPSVIAAGFQFRVATQVSAAVASQACISNSIQEIESASVTEWELINIH